jgi:hypothetical protein
MPAAQDKSALIAACEKEFAKLADLIAEIDDEVAGRPYDDGISIKDVIGHRAYWIDLWLGWDQAGHGGQDVHMPAEGYKWSELKALNEAVRNRQRDLGWQDVRTLLRDRHNALMKRLSDMSEDALYGAAMAGGNGKWTAGRYAESAGSSHYRSAAKFVRACLRNAKE